VRQESGDYDNRLVWGWVGGWFFGGLRRRVAQGADVGDGRLGRAAWWFVHQQGCFDHGRFRQREGGVGGSFSRRETVLTPRINLENVFVTKILKNDETKDKCHQKAVSWLIRVRVSSHFPTFRAETSNDAPTLKEFRAPC
jgi:hypothetical protein